MDLDSGGGGGGLVCGCGVGEGVTDVVEGGDEYVGVGMAMHLPLAARMCLV